MNSHLQVIEKQIAACFNEEIMKTVLKIMAVLWVSTWASLAATTEITPDVLVKSVTTEVIGIIKQDKDIQSGQTKKILDLVEAKVLPNFNFNRMTRLAVGKNWSKASPEEQQQLTKQFRTLLVRTYSNALSGYRDQTIEVKPVQIGASDVDAVVKTQVIQSGGQQPVTIDYSMEKSEQGWKVYDVTVAGVSLVTNYRSSFNTEVRDGGIEGLIKTLSEKNRKLETGQKGNG